MDQITLFSDSIKVFVCDVTLEMTEQKQKLCKVLSRARIKTVTAPKNATEDNVETLMRSCNCSVHILGKEDYYTTEGNAYSSNVGIQYRIAKKLRNKDFKVFLWNPLGQIDSFNQYINNIRRDIVDNTLYSATLSPIYFVEELRNMVSQESKIQGKTENKDIFFIFNYLDIETANSVTGMVEDVLSIKKLAVTMNTETDYSDYIKKQLPSCKVCIIYYDFATDWAISFTRQVWKDNGGQSGKTPIMLIGNSAHADENYLQIFKNVIETAICEVSLIPLEIKVFFDKMTNNIKKGIV